METSFYCTPEGGMSNYLFGLGVEAKFDAKCKSLGIESVAVKINCPWDREVCVGSDVIKVQIKSTRTLVRQSRGKGRPRERFTVPGIRSKTKRQHYVDSGVDFLAIYIEPQNRWFILPAGQARANRLNISPNPEGRMAAALERWDYLKISLSSSPSVSGQISLAASSATS